MRPPSRNQWRQAARLLRKGRVRVHAVGPHGCLAEVVGRSGTYEVIFEHGQWECTCAFQSYHPGRWCSHVTAVAQVWRAMTGGDEENERDAESGNGELG